jgi:hypothetical protein
MTQPATSQWIEGSDQPSHTHSATEHTHDHYHVTHRHGGMVGEFQHRSYWHTHEHNHAAMTHGHEYDRQEEDREHGKEAHIHDHTAPSSSPR